MQPLALATKGILSGRVGLPLASVGILSYRIIRDSVQPFEPYFILPVKQVSAYANQLSFVSAPVVYKSDVNIRVNSPVQLSKADSPELRREPSPELRNTDEPELREVNSPSLVDAEKPNI